MPFLYSNTAPLPMKTKAPKPRLSKNASDFLETLLWVAYSTDRKETKHIQNWTIHEFHPAFVAALETFLSSFRESLAVSHPDIDPDDCGRSFGGNVFFSLSGHGCGFFDERDSDLAGPLHASLVEFSGDKYRFQDLDGNLSKFGGKIHLAYSTAAFRKFQLDQLFGGFTVATGPVA